MAKIYNVGQRFVSRIDKSITCEMVEVQTKHYVGGHIIPNYTIKRHSDNKKIHYHESLIFNLNWVPIVNHKRIWWKLNEV